jgi:dynein light intermediate chain 1
LIYTTPFLASSLQSLIHSSLGIHSLLKRQSLKHNVIDRDKILVPSNWDSWGKIRIIREGFDIEGVGTNWSIEIQEPPESPPPPPAASADHADADQEEKVDQNPETGEDVSAVAIYEQTIQDPRFGAAVAANRPSANGNNKIEIETTDTQTFLGENLELLEQLKAEDEKAAQELRKNGTGAGLGAAALPPVKDGDNLSGIEEAGRVNEHIGPVQFNMGGIQVDADDMLRKLKVNSSNLLPGPSPFPSLLLTIPLRNAKPPAQQLQPQQPILQQLPSTPPADPSHLPPRPQRLASAKRRSNIKPLQASSRIWPRSQTGPGVRNQDRRLKKAADRQMGGRWRRGGVTRDLACM